MLQLVEDDLRFSDDELAGFAARRGLAVERLGDTGGWPAMAELAASVEGDLAGDYLWEEVLEPLGPERRRVLATLSDLGGADDDLAGAALGEPVELARVLDGVPLVARGAGGWRVPHPLWRTVRALALAARRAAWRCAAAAIGHLVAGAALRRGGHAWPATPASTTCCPTSCGPTAIGPQRPPARRLDRWLAAVPPDARDTPGAALGAGLRAVAGRAGRRHRAPARAPSTCATRRATSTASWPPSRCSGRVAWWHGDLVLLGELYPRVLELEAAGHALARGMAAVGRAVIADLEGDDDVVVAHARRHRAGRPRPRRGRAWPTGCGPARCRAWASPRPPSTSSPPSPRPPTPPSSSRSRASRLVARWALGHVDEVVAALPSLIERIRAAGIAQQPHRGAHPERVHLRHGRPARRGPPRTWPPPSGWRATARASPSACHWPRPPSCWPTTTRHTATTVLEKAVAAQGSVGGPDRRTWRHGLCLSYVLVPSTRDALGPPAHGRDRRVRPQPGRRGGRPAGGPAPARGGRVRPRSGCGPRLHHRFAVELALGLEAAGGRRAGPSWRRSAPRAATPSGPWPPGAARSARPARSLLAAVPAPPPHTTGIGCLGPLALERDGEVVTDPDLRRERVRALLAFLVSHRTTTRAAIVAALWPDLDERAAANNLRVTLTYLLRLLEPWRSARESAYFVRFDGPGRHAGDRASGCASTSTGSTTTWPGRPGPRPTARRRWRSATTWPRWSCTGASCTRACPTPSG